MSVAKLTVPMTTRLPFLPRTLAQLTLTESK
jgi:hypothetical protein